jgi:hypothetical protein
MSQRENSIVRRIREEREKNAGNVHVKNRQYEEREDMVIKPFRSISESENQQYPIRSRDRSKDRSYDRKRPIREEKESPYYSKQQLNESGMIKSMLKGFHDALLKRFTPIEKRRKELAGHRARLETRDLSVIDNKIKETQIIKNEINRAIETLTDEKSKVRDFYARLKIAQDEFLMDPHYIGINKAFQTVKINDAYKRKLEQDLMNIEGIYYAKHNINPEAIDDIEKRFRKSGGKGIGDVMNDLLGSLDELGFDSVYISDDSDNLVSVAATGVGSVQRVNPANIQANAAANLAQSIANLNPASQQALANAIQNLPPNVAATLQQSLTSQGFNPQPGIRNSQIHRMNRQP